jgi:hypothetical protein
MTNDPQTAAEQRGQQALAALAEEDAEVGAAATDRLMDDLGDAFAVRERDDRWDGPQ